MSFVRKRNSKWQCIVRSKGNPTRTLSFEKKSDAIIWGKKLSYELFKKNNNIHNSKFPSFRECLERYRDEIIVFKKAREMETKLVKYILTEPFCNYSIDRVSRSMMAKYRDRGLKTLCASSVNRRLAVISHMFTIARKEWDYEVDNPVLSISRPTNPDPRDRRFTDAELNKLLKGNRADPHMKFIIELALETALRRSEIANIKPEHVMGNMLKVVKAKIKPRTIPLTKRAQALLKSNLPITKSANAILMSWKRLMKFYDIKDAHFHDLRHESICRFFTHKNLSVPECQVISGHLEPRTLLKVYANIKAEDIVNKIN
jgi:integrase|tara:strand:+ start:140 stop:1087 length:948 start_codon:yes stop_codon:yes gene_type:complete